MARTFDHPGVVFPMLAIYVVLAPAMFVSSFVFFLRRKVHPVRGRGPIVILAINAVCLSHLTFICLEYLYPEGYPCSLAVAESPIHLMALALLYFTRLWRLWFQSRLSQAMAEMQTARRSRKAASHVDFAAKANGQGHDRPKKPSDPEDRKPKKPSDPEDRKGGGRLPRKPSDPEDRGSPSPAEPGRMLSLRAASAPLTPQTFGPVVSANDHVIVIHTRDGPPPSGSSSRSPAEDADESDYKRMFRSEVELQLVAEEYKNKELNEEETDQQAVSEDEDNYTSDSMAVPSSPSLAGRDPRGLRGERERSLRVAPPSNSPRVSRSDKSQVFQIFSSDPDGGEHLWMVDDPDLAESAGFFVRNRWLNSNSVVCAFLDIASLLVILMPWTVILDADTFPDARTDVVKCPFWAPTVYTIIIGVLVIVAFTALAVHLRGVSESLLIVLEMKAVAAASLVALIIYIVSSFGAAGSFHSDTFPIASMASILIIVVVWTMATLLPLYRSFVQLPLPPVDAALLSSVTLYDVLADDKATELFTEHLRSEFSAENLVFWESVEDFREFMQDPDLQGDYEKQRELALQIYRACIEPGAPYEVNFPSVIVKSIQATLFTDQAPRMVTIHNNDPTALAPSPRRVHTPEPRSGGTSPRRTSSPVLQRAPTSDELLFSRHIHEVPEIPRSPSNNNRERKGSTASHIGTSWVCGTTLPLFDATLFDEAQKCVFRLLNADSFIRFKTSEAFKHFLRERLRESALQVDQDHIAAFSPSVSRRASTRMRTQESTITVTGSPSQTALRHAAFTRMSSPSHSRNTASVAGAHESESKAQVTVAFALATSHSDGEDAAPERSVSRSRTRNGTDWNPRTFSARTRNESSRRELSLLYYAVPPALKPAGSPNSSPSVSRRNSQPGPLAQIPSLSLALASAGPDSNPASAVQTREPSREGTPRDPIAPSLHAPHHARGLSASTEDTRLPY